MSNLCTHCSFDAANVVMREQERLCFDVELQQQQYKRKLVYGKVITVSCPPTCTNLNVSFFGDSCAFSVYSSICLSGIFAGAYKPGKTAGASDVSVSVARSMFERIYGRWWVCYIQAEICWNSLVISTVMQQRYLLRDVALPRCVLSGRR